MNDKLIKLPSAWLPLLMSMAALFLLLGYILFIGLHAPQTDEGTAARIFQILILGQIPIVIFFIFRWLPHWPQTVGRILTWQIFAALIPLILVKILEM